MELPIRYRGRQATSEEVAFIRQLITANPHDSRRALNLLQPNGTPRDMVCRGYMLALHRAGLIRLPAKDRLAVWRGHRLPESLYPLTSDFRRQLCGGPRRIRPNVSILPHSGVLNGSNCLMRL